MNILAFESSCDETAAAVVRDGRTVLADAIASQVEMHTIYGGVVPEIASRKHVQAIAALTDKALADAGLAKKDIDAVAVTYAPGLIGAVLVGVSFAKSAAYALGVPLIPVHHVRGHIAANYLAFPELEPPFVALAISGALRVGDVVAFILYAKLFAGPLESIASGLSTMQHTFASAGRVYELLDREEMDSTENAPLVQGEDRISFDHVYFSYDPAHPLIEDLCIDVAPGQKVAIVGPTGGGKTTIVNLLMRFYDVDSGAITINGVDTRTMDRAALRSRFSMVLQDTWLFSGSIYENIAYGKRDATREEVLEAARRAHIDFFIDTLPDGYDTVINEESTNISSGQKQLLTIARAYLANRSILILDEATSNVHTRTELLIQHTMDDLMRGRTSFVIAHRLSTIVDADVILVVDNGRIVEQGTHAQLLAKNGFYAEIYNSQYALLR